MLLLRTKGKLIRGGSRDTRGRGKRQKARREKGNVGKLLKRKEMHDGNSVDKMWIRKVMVVLTKCAWDRTMVMMVCL